MNIFEICMGFIMKLVGKKMFKFFFLRRRIENFRQNKKYFLVTMHPNPLCNVYERVCCCCCRFVALCVINISMHSYFIYKFLNENLY